MREKEFKNVRWGDIYYCDLGVTNGSVQSGMRPVLVVQTNRLNESSPTVVVAAITAVKKKTAMNTHIELNTDCGLKEPSMVMLGKTATYRLINQCRFKTYNLQAEMERRRYEIGSGRLRTRPNGYGCRCLQPYNRRGQAIQRTEV